MSAVLCIPNVILILQPKESNIQYITVSMLHQILRMYIAVLIISFQYLVQKQCIFTLMS